MAIKEESVTEISEILAIGHLVHWESDAGHRVFLITCPKCNEFIIIDEEKHVSNCDCGVKWHVQLIAIATVPE